MYPLFYANSSRRICECVWSIIMPILFVLSYVLSICHMAQFKMVWPIFFRGDSLSRCQVNVHFVMDFIFQSYGFIFSKLFFPHKFSFAPPGYVLTKCGNVPRICCGNLLSCSILEAIASLGIRWLNVPVIASELFQKLRI